MEEENFELLIEKSKEILNRLNRETLTLEESLEFYKQGITNLNKAQCLLEKAKLEYSHLAVDKDLV